MSVHSTGSLESLLRKCGLGWKIDGHAPPEDAIPHIVRLLDAATDEAHQRFGSAAPEFTEEAISAEYERNPHKVEAFLQVLGSVKSPSILVLIWRILQGMEIDTLDVQYQKQESFRLRVVLRSPYDAESPETYESQDISDAVFLRHLGIAKVNDRPVFDGYYALRLA